MESPTFFLCYFFLLSRRETILFPWKVDDLLPKRKGKVALFSVHYDMFFLLDSQVVCIFCPKECLTTLRVVMCPNYTRRLGNHPVVLSQPRPVSGNSWAQAHGIHNAPLFPVGEEVIPGGKKKMCLTSLVWRTADNQWWYVPT